MTARSWWRRVRGGRALELAEQEIEFQLEARAEALKLATRLGNLLDERTVERDQALADVQRLERERDAWRLRARSAPLTPVDEERARAVRHADAEQTGGR